MPTQYNQRDLVSLKLPFVLPDGSELRHPILIISSNRSNSHQNRYTGVMLTSSLHMDKFSFPCDDTMFESPLREKDCQIRSYIILGINELQIDKFVNRMKPLHFKVILSQIKELVFCID